MEYRLQRLHREKDGTNYLLHVEHIPGPILSRIPEAVRTLFGLEEKVVRYYGDGKEWQQIPDMSPCSSYVNTRLSELYQQDVDKVNAGLEALRRRARAQG